MTTVRNVKWQHVPKDEWKDLNEKENITKSDFISYVKSLYSKSILHLEKSQFTWEIFLQENELFMKNTDAYFSIHRAGSKVTSALSQLESLLNLPVV